VSSASDPTATAPRRRSRMRGAASDVLAWAGLGAAVLAILWPLGLTNRILAGVDAFTYFEPYWTYRNAVLATGHLPLWNPFLFLGVPFLANPQAAVLYPLHWPLVWLPAERALIWSALLHIWLAAGFTYMFARRSFTMDRLSAWLAGLLYGLGGFALARVENINQLNAMAWLPAMLWLYDETRRSSSWRVGLRWGTGLTLAIVLQFLAGHTQTAFVNMVGLGLYGVYGPAQRMLARIVSRSRHSDVTPPLGTDSTREPPSLLPPQQRREALRALLPLLALIPAVLLISAQLLPSLELNRLGLRTQGLPYRQAVSFSLRPRLLLQSFLPPLGGGLAEAFATEGYAEFVAYVGITGLILAGLAVARLARSRSGARKTDAVGENVASAVARGGSMLFLALSGAFLGLGAYNPIYYVLWRVIPGFSLFRAPVRWLELTALGLAVLAGIGLNLVGRRTASQDRREGSDGIPDAGAQRIRSRRGLVIAVLLLVGFGALLVFQQWPAPTSVLLWIAAAALAGACIWAAGRWPHAARAGLVALAMAELWLASRALPFTLATAPYVLSLRNAPSALLAQTGDQPAAGRDRFLSMSDIGYDPGDLAEMRDLMAGWLPQDAVERLVRGAKQTEVIAPNISLRLQLPGMDGYDGGLLPTQDYGKLQTLFLPASQRLPDGRMGQQLREIPPGRLLDLAAVRFVLTDKQNDLWADNVYYDLEQAASLEPGESVTFDLEGQPGFPSTGLGIVSHLDGSAQEGTPVAEVEVQTVDEGTITLPVRAGIDTAPGQGPAGGARVARVWPRWIGVEGQDYLSLLQLPKAMLPAAITVRAPVTGTTTFVLQGLSLVDKRTGEHSSVTVSPRGDFRRIHSGDVKVYERTGTQGRAWLVHGIQPVADDDAALDLLAQSSFDPKQTVALEGQFGLQPPKGALEGEKVEVLEFGPERVHLKAEVSEPAVLVLADAFYPGWRAVVDGEPAPIIRANLMFRAVMLGPGSHDVLLSYEPLSWHLGLIVSVATLALVAGGFVATFAPTRKSRSRAV
jgi:hypothetical protein